ncbi:MAG TPA: RtcB family protein [Bacteroidia bacterium]|jgi:tRNA-splicing ligase RtcB
MAKLKLRGKDLRKLGYPENRVIGIAIEVMHKHYKHSSLEEALEMLSKVLAAPAEYLEDPVLVKIADALVEKPGELNAEIPLLEEKREYNIFGRENIEEGAIRQMDIAVRLPIAVAGSLMPDAHQGYGLPIGGVLATENAVIPYGVGVDIGCRMCLSIFDLPAIDAEKRDRRLQSILKDNTLFGSGQEFKVSADHEVMERKEFEEIALVKKLRQRAAKQLGSSGSGNHFVEFGVVEISDEHNEFKLPVGKYLALLSHSGSRGLGANIANHYTKIAMEKTRLPKEAKHLAWLGLGTQEGMEYWLAMNLAGDYASACHHTIHKKIAKELGTQPVAVVENHHNFAWKEMLNGKEVIVHRKGATPAGKGVLGIIPGSMSAPGFIVRGKGEEAALNSASHGAGRKMSRTQALNTITHKALRDILEAHGVLLMGGGLDEAPHAYKDIHEVIKAQKHLVDIVGTFFPKIVRMDG